MHVWSGLLGLRYLVLGELVGTIFCGDFLLGVLVFYVHPSSGILLLFSTLIIMVSLDGI